VWATKSWLYDKAARLVIMEGVIAMAHLWIRSFAALPLFVILTNQTQAYQINTDPYTATVGAAYGYMAEGSAAPFQSIAGQPGTSYMPFQGTANPNDDGYVSYKLPFSFGLFNSQLSVGNPMFISANGYITFGTPSISPIPSNFLTGAPSFGNQPALAPLFMDLIARGAQAGGPGLYLQLSGQPGQRRLTIEWSAMQDYNNGQPSNPVSFQAVLFEGSNNIQFNYGSTLFGTPGNNGMLATVGIRDVSLADPPDNVLQWGYLPTTSAGVGESLGSSNFQINFLGGFVGFSSIPEPTSLALCAFVVVGSLGVMWFRWRGKRRSYSHL
jgi:hypothetical protein